MLLKLCFLRVLLLKTPRKQSFRTVFITNPRPLRVKAFKGHKPKKSHIPADVFTQRCSRSMSS